MELKPIRHKLIKREQPFVVRFEVYLQADRVLLFLDSDKYLCFSSLTSALEFLHLNYDI